MSSWYPLPAPPPPHARPAAWGCGIRHILNSLSQFAYLLRSCLGMAQTCPVVGVQNGTLSCVDFVDVIMGDIPV